MNIKKAIERANLMIENVEEHIKLYDEAFANGEDIEAVKVVLEGYENLIDENEHYKELMNALETYYAITEEDIEKSVKEDK